MKTLEHIFSGHALWLRTKFQKKTEGARMDCSGRDFSGSNLRGSIFRDAILTQTNFSGSNLIDSDLSGSSLEKANLSAALLQRARIIQAQMYGTDLSWANLSDGLLRGSTLDCASLQSATMVRTDLSFSSLVGANLRSTCLFRADLSRSNLHKADLTQADLSQVNLAGANLVEAKFDGANLRRANLTEIFGDLFSRCFLSPQDIPDLIERLSSGVFRGRLKGVSVYGFDAYLREAAVRRGEMYPLEEILPSETGIGQSWQISIAAGFRHASPIDTWFLAIDEGDTPSNSQIVSITVEWLESFLNAAKSLYGVS